ncbi:MAG: YccF domain-containing protein [Salibacteraceae bacterium]
MLLIGNLLWLLLGGFFIFLEYFIAGLLWCLTIIGIPFGLQLFKIGVASLWPFGRAVVTRPDSGTGSLLLNVLWLIFGGLSIALSHLAFGVAFCLTIIGIPFGLQHFKLMRLSFFPFSSVFRTQF